MGRQLRIFVVGTLHDSSKMESNNRNSLLPRGSHGPVIENMIILHIPTLKIIKTHVSSKHRVMNENLQKIIQKIILDIEIKTSEEVLFADDELCQTDSLTICLLTSRMNSMTKFCGPN
jgi:hypothetical protein